MKLYWADNTGLRGTRWVFAESEESARDMCFYIGMVQRPSNLKLEEVTDPKYLPPNIEPVNDEGFVYHTTDTPSHKLKFLIEKKQDIYKHPACWHYKQYYMQNC